MSARVGQRGTAFGLKAQLGRREHQEPLDRLSIRENKTARRNTGIDRRCVACLGWMVSALLFWRRTRAGGLRRPHSWRSADCGNPRGNEEKGWNPVRSSGERWTKAPAAGGNDRRFTRRRDRNLDRLVGALAVSGNGVHARPAHNLRTQPGICRGCPGEFSEGGAGCARDCGCGRCPPESLQSEWAGRPGFSRRRQGRLCRLLEPSSTPRPPRRPHPGSQHSLCTGVLAPCFNGSLARHCIADTVLRTRRHAKEDRGMSGLPTRAGLRSTFGLHSEARFSDNAPKKTPNPRQELCIPLLQFGGRPSRCSVAAWWARRDSNPGPLPCEGSALTN